MTYLIFLALTVLASVHVLTYDSIGVTTVSNSVRCLDAAVCGNGPSCARVERSREFSLLTVAFILYSASIILAQFLIPWARVGKLPKAAEDPAAGQKLWEWLEEHTKDI